MARQTYEVRVGGKKRFSFTADLSEASASIRLIGDAGEDLSTPFQTADAGHRRDRAAELLVEWVGEDMVGADEEWEAWEDESVDEASA